MCGVSFIWIRHLEICPAGQGIPQTLNSSTPGIVDSSLTPCNAIVEQAVNAIDHEFHRDRAFAYAGSERPASMNRFFRLDGV